jgi:V/A-type H+/Na+-transporting ATPase subunit G/H
MEDILKRLLEAEMRAEAQVEEASRQREAVIAQALDESRLAEERFHSRVEALHAPYLAQGAERSEQAIAELKKKYEERSRHLRALAESHEREAIDAAFAVLRGSTGI